MLPPTGAPFFGALENRTGFTMNKLVNQLNIERFREQLATEMMRRSGE